MIKFSIIFIVLYFVLNILLRLYVKGLSRVDQLRISVGNVTKGEQISFMILGAMKVLSIIFVAIDVIILVVKYL